VRTGLALLEALGVEAKEANAQYHDGVARTYDAKWGISYDEPGLRYVRDRVDCSLPRRSYRRVLDLGCGTGFFLLNLWQLGYVEEAHGLDISLEMLRTAEQSARRMGCEAAFVHADAETLPYADRSFDLVTGHGFLHHLPEPHRFLREAYRVLRAGGALLLAAEPTPAGDRLCRSIGRGTWTTFRCIAKLMTTLGLPTSEARADPADEWLRKLEFAVDLHTFEPDRLASMVRAAGFGHVHVTTEGLTSAMASWLVRTVEAEARPGLLGPGWARTTRSLCRVLGWLDRRVWTAVVPRRVFYDVVLYGTKV
jgi:ubiquinone/menaquinone biosynthesis C-methylase UbiE